MPRITRNTSLIELAATVSEALESAGLVATLSGGSAVSVYTENRYRSNDLDFVTAALRREIEPVLAPLGFVHAGSPRLSVFTHPDTDWYLEFPPAPLGFGSLYVDPEECAILSTPVGDLRIITPTYSVMDRLIAAASWHDPQALDQAILVATNQDGKIDWEALDEWIGAEAIATAPEVRDFRRAVGRSPD